MEERNEKIASGSIKLLWCSHKDFLKVTHTTNYSKKLDKGIFSEESRKEK